MADVVSPRVRSRMMSGIKGKNTWPEIMLRQGLHRRGFRFRLHTPDLPGKPDLVFPKYHAVLFVHGCFWHGHDCPLFRWPKSREEFWRAKISQNVERDRETITRLRSVGWRVAEVWECALKGRSRLPEVEILDCCATWLRSSEMCLSIRGNRQTRV